MTVKTGLPKLPLPAEPSGVQRRFELDMEGNAWLARATIRQGGWLGPELWRLWEPWLEEEGLTPEIVTNGVRNCAPYFLQWIEHEISWEEAISQVVKSIQTT